MPRDLALCALTLALAIAPGLAQAVECPSEPEVKATLTKWHTNLQMENAKTWQIKSVLDFNFGSLKFGSIVQRQVEWGKPAQDVCPVRIEFSFVVERNDGRRTPQSHGVNQTYLFYKNGFGEWVQKSSSN